MKKLALFVFSLCCCLVFTGSASAQCGMGGCGSAPVSNDCGVSCDQEYAGNGPCICYCPMVKYTPEYYYTTRCEYDPYNVYHKHCNMVPEYYEQTFCRMVPEYYTKTFCKQRPEYYYTTETKYKARTCYDKQCRMIPSTYYKKVCSDVNPCANGQCGAPACAPVAQPCAPAPMAQPSCGQPVVALSLALSQATHVATITSQDNF